MAINPSFKRVHDVETYVNEKISSQILGGSLAKFEANTSDEFSSIGSRCILDRASILNIDPQEIVEPVLTALSDSRFSSERGFLNFSDNDNPEWILSAENFELPQNLSVYILKDGLNQLSSLRLRLMATFQSYVSNKRIALVDNIVSASEIDEIIENQKPNQVVVIWCAHNGLPSNLFNKLVRAPAREKGMLSFQVLAKPFMTTKIVQWPENYLDTICIDTKTLLSASFYYSLPIQASDLDPLSCRLEENANLLSFGSRTLVKIRSLFPNLNKTVLQLPAVSRDDFIGATTRSIALSLKLLPMRLRTAVFRGDVFSFTQGLHKLLTDTERILNKPDFRAIISQQKVSPIDLFIVNNLVDQLDLIFSYESKT